jgi:glycosyltransferase 2 family protein
MAMANCRKTVLFLVKLALSLGGLVLVFLLSRAKFPEIGRTLAAASWGWLAVAFSLHTLGLLFSAYRWQILAQAQGDHIPLGYLVKSYIVGRFFNTFLPTSVGGDVVRMWDGAKYSTSFVKSSAIVVVERATGIIVLFLFALLASLLRLDMARRIPVIEVALLLGAAGLIATAVFFLPAVGRLLARGPEHGFRRRLFDKMRLFRGTIVDYRRHPAAFVRATAWAVLLQLNVVIYYILIGRALGLAIPALDYFVFIPLVLLLQIIPVFINGFGIREISYVAVFAFYGLAASAAWSFALVEIAFGLIIGLLGAVIYITRR